MVIHNKLYNILLSTLIIMSSVSWASAKPPFPTHYKKAILYFGQGGGFTGAITTYALLENGRLYRKNSLTDKEFIWVTRLDRKTVDQCFNNYTFLGIPSLQIQDPGNIYYFVEYSNKNDNHKLTWNNKTEVQENLKLFYSLLYHFIPPSQ